MMEMDKSQHMDSPAFVIYILEALGILMVVLI